MREASPLFNSLFLIHPAYRRGGSLKGLMPLHKTLFPFPLTRGRGHRGWGYLIEIKRGREIGHQITLSSGR